MVVLYVIVFFQAEDGIRDYRVTGVQTCALPICGTARLFTIVVAVWIPESPSRRRRPSAHLRPGGLLGRLKRLLIRLGALWVKPRSGMSGAGTSCGCVSVISRACACG